MADYLILIHRDETAIASPKGDEVSTPYVEFMRRHSGSLRGGAGLEPSDTATSVRWDGRGGSTVTDGPFAESKEALVGYFVVEAADLDEAIAIAKDIPADATGGVEVRPIRVQS